MRRVAEAGCVARIFHEYGGGNTVEALGPPDLMARVLAWDTAHRRKAGTEWVRPNIEQR
jgi:hypothetical protein